MYLKVKRAEKRLQSFGEKKFNEFVVKMIGLYEDDGTRIKRVKLNDVTLGKLKEMRVEYKDPREQKLL